jgi:hypothetical protein
MLILVIIVYSVICIISSLFYVFIYDRFNEAASTRGSDYVVSGGRIITEHCVLRNVEGTSHVQIWVSVWKFNWR